jgi:hypothetical protein
LVSTGKGGSAPQLNGQQVGQQQVASNLNTAFGQSVLNNTNQVTPYGNLTYTKNPPTDVMGTSLPSWTATTTLDPAQQRILDSQTSATGKTYDLANQYADRIKDATAKPYSYDGLPAAPQYDEAARTAARDRITARQEPIFDRQDAGLRTRLANQGLQPGTEAYTNAMRDQSTRQNDYYLGADAQAGDEASRIFGLQGTTRDRAINEMAGLRSQPINEVSALLGTGGVQSPNFVNTPQTQVQAADVTTPQLAQYQGQMQQWQQGQQNNNALMGSLFGLAGAGLGGWARGGFPSDIRIKENIERVATTPNGLGIYSYNHIGESARRIGLMAQEVEKVRPSAVFEVNGIKHVDYAEALAPHAVEGGSSASFRHNLGDSGILAELPTVRLSDLEHLAGVGRKPRHDAALSVASDFGGATAGQEQRKSGDEHSHGTTLAKVGEARHGR